MPTYRAQVVIPHSNGIVKDAITNTFHFIDFVPQPLVDLANAVSPLLDAFYTSIYTTSSTAANYMAWGLTRINWYDLSEPTPRVPYTVATPISVTAVATTIPSEVSVVASFQAARAPGIPQSRRRGRIYLGGLGPAWMDNSAVGTSPYVANGRLATVANAMDTLNTAVAATSARWAVWSPTDQAAYLVTNGWCENAPDTQRRRGVVSTVRTLWS